MTPETVLEALDPEQRVAASALHGPVCILAGAGTGKTRAITHRIAYGVLTGTYAPAQVLAVTFTARAAGEMRARLRALGAGGVQARTFHAAALRQLQYFWPKVVGGELPRIVDTKARLVAEASSRAGLGADRAEVRDLAAEIEWAKVTQTAPDDYPAVAATAGRQPPRDAPTVARVYAGYEELKRERGFIDFEDVLLLAVGMLDARDDIATAVRAQYRHFVVDEYQDVSPLQQRLLDLWLGERDSVCVVGDAAQTIYSFAGATPDYLLDFRRRWPQATEVRLVRDYRSTPQVVRVANTLLEGAGGRTAAARLRLVAQRPDGPEPVLREYPDEPAEAQGVTAAIRRLVDAGTRPSEIAVLYRINAQSEPYEQALADAGLPALVRGGERFFDRPEVRAAVLLLRGAARGAAPSERGEGLVAEVSAVLAATGWSPQAPAGTGATRERWESVTALVRLAENLAAADPEATLATLVADLDERAAAQHAPTVEGVTLASLHASKGLEWDAVFLVGLVEGLLPHAQAVTPEAVEEERRLLYVGATRARTSLALSWASARAPGGRGSRRPSRFLDRLLASGVSGSAAGPAARRASGRARRGPVVCRSCGRPLVAAVERKLGRCAGCPSTIDEALFERLRAWRLAEAREQAVPAFCVFTDATLTAIAESRPSTLPELGKVPGVGRAKLDRYGPAVLALCAAR